MLTLFTSSPTSSWRYIQVTRAGYPHASLVLLGRRTKAQYRRRARQRRAPAPRAGPPTWSDDRIMTGNVAATLDLYTQQTTVLLFSPRGRQVIVSARNYNGQRRGPSGIRKMTTNGNRQQYGAQKWEWSCTTCPSRPIQRESRHVSHVKLVVRRWHSLHLAECRP